MFIAQTQLEGYLDSLANGSLPVNMEHLQNISKDIVTHVEKSIKDDPNGREFTLRFSSIGRPLCQLQMEKARAVPERTEFNMPVRMLYGSVIEALFVMFMKEAGINITAEQQEVELPFKVKVKGEDKTITLKGTLDIIIDDETVWDIKSASGYSYREKFNSYHSLREGDTFGYIAQLFGYAKASGKKPGGWIVINKETGEFKFIHVPNDYQKDMEESLAKIRDNIETLLNTSAPTRLFEPVEETFYRKPTGNKILNPVCRFCKFKKHCFPDLKYIPNPFSKAKDAPMVYYTELNNTLEIKDAKGNT